MTLTGVGGVGKTRLAVQVAAELTGEFPDGVWLVELAPVGDPAVVADVVATELGVTPQAGFAMVDRIAQALSGRRLLVVLDNCEHVLDAAGDLVETILARTTTVKVIATSREGLRVAAEQLWVVPSLDVGAGAASAAVELFVARARAVVAGFAVHDEADSAAVTEICRRLDGIPLAIELAAARMVSMNPAEVVQRLSDRFRLLSGSRRGLERHQTLRHAVQWSYDLLDDDERAVLDRCSVFAGGFDVAAATHVCGDVGFDEYTVLDLLDSLVRKSLVTTEQISGHTRYAMLETIRQFAEDQLAATGSIERGAGPTRRVLRRAGRRALGRPGTGPASGSRSTGWTSSSPTSAPGSAGPPTRETSPAPRPSPLTAPSWPSPFSATNRPGGPRRSSPRPPPPTSPNFPASTSPPASA